MYDDWLNITPDETRLFFEQCKLTKKKWYLELPNEETLLYAYFVIRRRMIQPEFYVIDESEESKQSQLPTEVEKEFHELKIALSDNKDLKKYHTNNSRILYPVDGLLEDWNINHLHLLKGKYQVFFIAEDKRMFILKVVKHFARHHTDYSKIQLLTILKNNRPGKSVIIPLKEKYKSDSRLSAKYPSTFGWYMTDKWKEKQST